MDNKQEDILKNKKPSTIFPALIVLLSLLILFLLAAPVYRAQMGRAQARIVLTRSKAVELAAITVAMEHYTQNRAFNDQTQPYGFAEGVIEEIRALAGCDGEIYLIQWDEREFRPLKLMYIEDGYTSVYKLENGETTWNVYQSDHVIVHE